MIITTKRFGEIDVADDKILTFQDGIIGFPEMKRFTLIHDADQGDNAGIRYLQSIEEPGFAMPVMDPLAVKPDYDPMVDEELLGTIGTLTAENTLVLVTVRVPSDLREMSVNLQGPFVINVSECKGCQLIVDSAKYPVRFPIYEILKAGKAGE